MMLPRPSAPRRIPPHDGTARRHAHPRHVRLAWLLAVLVACSSSSENTPGGDGSGGEDGSPDGASEPGDGADGSTDGEPDAGTLEDAGLGPCDGGQREGCVVTEPEPACGDGLINVAGEQCDDGNGDSDDGCTANCMRDPDYACPAPGEPCVYTVVCGDSKISGPESCDDGNADPLDGCDAGCKVEPGYACPVVGFRCQAAACGDGIVVGLEECDFPASVTGCTDCRIDVGFDCDASTCTATVCGNGMRERGEQCDDGDGLDTTADVPFDGCFDCRAEPACQGGVCTAVCGDGQRFADEACDDGNLRAGDGCSPGCEIETAFACDDELAAPADSVILPILLRDFIGKDRSNKTGCDDPIAVPASTNPCYHIDFNRLGGSVRTGVLESELDENGRPVYVCPDPDACLMNPGHVANGGRFTFNGRAAFDQWYGASSPNAFEVVSEVNLARNATSGVYVFDSAPQGGFYPLDGKGWVAEGSESSTKDCNDNPGRNVSFTSETHFWFEYQGGESFEFVGDDDLWVFVNGRLALDLGGLHGALTARFTLGPVDDGSNGSIDVVEGTARVQNQALGHNLGDASSFSLVELGLTLGGVYEITMLHAERNECGSNFKVTLKDFNRPKSRCASDCGDGQLASDELCDAGEANEDPAPYGGCSTDCKTRGHYCGDGIVDDAEGEACDDGSNVTVYAQQEGDCAPDCKLPAHCGDGVVQSSFGERCDDGINDGRYGGCTPTCLPGPRCGDGVVQAEGGEECDDGNRDSYDGCNVSCATEVIQ